MTLGYTDPATGAFVKASSVSIRNTMRVSDDEATRKACFEVRLGVHSVINFAYLNGHSDWLLPVPGLQPPAALWKSLPWKACIRVVL